MEKTIDYLDLSGTGDEVFITIGLNFDNDEEFLDESIMLAELANQYRSREVTTVTDTVDAVTRMHATLCVPMYEFVNLCIRLQGKGWFR